MILLSCLLELWKEAASLALTLTVKHLSLEDS